MYNTLQLKYGWYEIIGKDALCRIKPIYDEQVRLCITDNGEIYSVVKQNGLFGIIKFNDKRFPKNEKYALVKQNEFWGLIKFKKNVL